MKLEVQNADRLLRKLTQIPEAMREKIRVAMADQADEIVEMMRRLCPVDEGDLRDSIGWRWGNKAPEGSISVGQVRVPAGASDLTLTIFAGNNRAYYAGFIEWGTVKMVKRPFFFPAYRASRKAAKSKVRSAVRAAAKEVASSS